MGLAISLNPLVNELRPIVEQLFPVSEAVKSALTKMLLEVPSLPVSLLVFALIPAVCEEFAFRGYILSALEHGQQPRTAILLSALLFGFLHVLLSLFQQLFNATLLGIVLGLLAIRSGSILPGIVFHFLNNGMAVALGHWVEHPSGRRFASWIYRSPAQGLYHGWLVAVGALVSALLLAVLVRDGGRSRTSKGPTSSEPFEVIGTAS